MDFVAVQTMPRRLLGGELRRLRLAAGKSLDAASATIGKHRGKLIKIEDGRSTASVAELEQLLTFFGASTRDRKKILALGAEARKRLPKRAYVDLLPGANNRIADLEADATRILNYDRTVIPGLLQTPEYAEAMMASADWVWWPTRSDEERAKRVAFRMERQKAIAGKKLVFLITDDALASQPGGREVMRRQVERLLEASQQPNISLRLLDSTDPRNPCPHGGMILLEFKKGTPPVSLLPVAYGPSTYLDEPSDTDAVTRAFQRLSEIASSEEESRSRLAAALEAM